MNEAETKEQERSFHDPKFSYLDPDYTANLEADRYVPIPQRVVCDKGDIIQIVDEKHSWYPCLLLDTKVMG